jgi:hypothetical protein
MKHYLLIFSLLICSVVVRAQNTATPSTTTEKSKINGYQIFLKQPAKEIKLLMYDKNFLPIHGTLSEDRKSIIMKDYIKGNRVYAKVVYDDGTVDEFTKSPCYIDPVIL